MRGAQVSTRRRPWRVSSRRLLRSRRIGKRHTAFARAIRVYYDEVREQIVYLHATKGWRRRDATPEMFTAMLEATP